MPPLWFVRNIHKIDIDSIPTQQPSLFARTLQINLLKFWQFFSRPLFIEKYNTLSTPIISYMEDNIESFYLSKNKIRKKVMNFDK